MNKIVRGITDDQSYALVIRDSIFAVVVTLPFFAGWKARRQKMLQVQPEHVPYVGLYFIDEVMTPDGDPDVGDIRFIHMVRLGFSVFVLNNDPVAAEQKLDAAYWAIMNGVWRNDRLTNFLHSQMPDNTRIEGVPRGVRRHLWGTAGLNNELPVAEMQYEATLTFRTQFAPVITDDLLRMHVETVPLAADGTVPPADVVQRIISEYEFTPP